MRVVAGQDGMLGRLAVLALAVAAEVAIGAQIARSGAGTTLGAVVAVIALVALLLSDRALLITVFVAKALIDMFWFVQIEVGGLELNPQSILGIVVPLLAVLVVLQRRPQLPGGLMAAMGLFVSANIYSVFVTPGTMYALEELLRIAGPFVLVFVILAIGDRVPEPRTILRMFLAVIGVVYLTVLLQPLGILSYSSFESGVARATGLFYHPWDVARYLVVATPLLLAMLNDEEIQGAERFAYRVLFVATLAVTFVTFLKMAWFVVLAEIVLWNGMAKGRKVPWLPIAAIVALMALPSQELIVRTFADVFRLGDPEQISTALSGRVFLWESYGADVAAAGVRELALGWGYLPPGMLETGRAVHNDYLRLLVMNGIFGVVTYLGLIGVAWTGLSRAVKSLGGEQSPELRIGIAAQIVMLGYLASGLSTDASTYPSLTWYVWILVGLTLAYARRRGAAEVAGPAPSTWVARHD